MRIAISTLLVLGNGGFALVAVPVSWAGTANWACVLSTADHDAIVEPGEAMRLDFSYDMRPAPGEWDEDLGHEVFGFAGASVQFLGQSRWATGFVTWEINPNLLGLTGDITARDDATQDLTQIYPGQLYDSPAFDTRDPLPIISLFWDPQGDYTPRDVSVVADTADGGAGDDTIGVWMSTEFGKRSLPWDTGDLVVSFQVVPAPAGAPLLPLAALFGLRRRR